MRNDAMKQDAAAQHQDKTAPVKIRCLRPFYVNGKPLAVGEVAELSAFDARSLAAIGKVELL